MYDLFVYGIIFVAVVSSIILLVIDFTDTTKGANPWNDYE